MTNIEWLENNQIKLKNIIKKPKKITGTRLAAVLNSNKYSTPFEVWCAITRTYEKPFEDTVYTWAGKIIEPLQIEYFKSISFQDVITPEDIYGKNHFQKTWGDFFKEEKIFGGSWDSLVIENGKTDAIIEFKTSSRPEDWQDSIPAYYSLQACLYAYLLKVDNVYVPVSFLTSNIYDEVQSVMNKYTSEEVNHMIDNGEIYKYVSFKPNFENTAIPKFKLSEMYPKFQECIDYAEQFWNEYVLTGISPEYCEKRDAHVLKELRKNTLNPTTDINQVLEEADTLRKDINAVELTIADKQKQLKVLETQIKDYMSNQFRDGDKQVALNSQSYVYTLSRKETMKVDNDALKADGLFDKYATNTITTTLTKKEIK